MNDLILSTGSNIGERVEFLEKAKNLLSKSFQLIESSRIYESPAVDYLNQPNFLNQVLHLKSSIENPSDVLKMTLEIENELGRKREIDKGPRTLDIDILFWNLDSIDLPNLQVPHPRMFQRSFIAHPLFELKISKKLQEKFPFPSVFDNSCWVLGETKS